MKLLNKYAIYIVIIISLFLSFDCNNKKEQEKYIAKVNNVYLTESELKSILDSNNLQNLTKNEIIRYWVTDELLYQEAVKKGITKQIYYKQLIKNSKRKISGSLLIKEILTSGKLNITENKLENFYFKHKDDFKLFNNATLLNRISFNEEDKAILFRNTVIKSDWDNAVRVFRNDSTVVNNKTGLLLYDYQIQSKLLLRVIKGLNKNEVSLVLHYIANTYTVVQVKEKFRKGITPPFPLIKDKVREMYLAQEQQFIIKNYLDNLRSNNDIEIIN
ncbi:MAG: peptidyl-prolyl cis-trans isomerase [Bacteroidetes bacterium]|nr:peptidyl-prolyl cis-trans isomerase [Bacteroidota bacterium]MCH8326136.1 peptidyl-prolyl cis-trans isomerase [Bacteroidota bacterium]